MTMEQLEIDEAGVAEESNSVLNEAASDSKTSTRKREYDLADSRLFTMRNAQTDYKILLALYEHRALTAAQLRKRCFPTYHENSIRNRLKTLADRKILSVNIKPGIKASPVSFYSLTAFGLRIVIENILDVMEFSPHFGGKKEHYTIDDLKVRAQHNHHYDLQEWVISILSNHPELFHCEWKRFPFLEGEESVKVKPDWVFLEADEETVERRRGDITNNPLLYPYFFRKEEFTASFTPLLCGECDRGTMTRSDLMEKWERYKGLTDPYKPKAISVFYSPDSTKDTRHRLLRETLRHSFELEVTSNELQLFQGDPKMTQDIVSLYFERDKDLLKDEKMTDEKGLQALVEAYSRSLEKGAASVLDVMKTVQHFRLPVHPDAIILKEQESPSFQLVFYAMSGWVNPVIKIQVIQKWLQEGHISQFSDIRFVLYYPDNRFLSDITPIDPNIYFVSHQEIAELGTWGKAHYEERKNKQVKWKEVVL